MPSLSPSPQPGATSSSPRPSAGQNQRPVLSKRHSSQSSAALHRLSAASPGSVNEQYQAQPKHAVRTSRHAKIVLPRNHSSGRNLAKLSRQVQQQHQHQEDERRHVRKRSHEHGADTEIRLPGSLDDNRPPPMRRNLTANQLVHTNSHVKLKKNLSHGHLSRLQSGKNLSALSSTQQKAPLSPGLKGKSKRPKSADLARQDINLYEQEAAILRKQEEEKLARQRVDFAVGSGDDGSDQEDELDMEASGLQEDEWTEESASASPFSTRQNTANNSRRASEITHDKPPPERGSPLAPRPTSKAFSRTQHSAHQEQQVIATTSHVPHNAARPTNSAINDRLQDEGKEDSEERNAQDHGNESDDESASNDQHLTERRVSPLSRSRAGHSKEVEVVIPEVTHQFHRQPVEPAKAAQRSPLHVGVEHTNPATRRILSRSQQLPAPALISNISALDDGHTGSESPGTSRRSSKSQIDGGSVEGEDELVSRFIPSTSHPTLGSGGNTTSNTPRQSGFHTPLEDHMRKSRGQPFHAAPTSPGSTVSGSSGAATPAFGRSRIELKMLGEKALADREAVAERAPIYPHHVYDRRNETLKSYLNLSQTVRDGRGGAMSGPAIALGPEIFQGRFKAVNTELKVVLKFRNPIIESAERLRHIKGTKLQQLASASRQQRNSGLKTSKSAVALPTRHASKLSTSTTPPTQVSSTMAATTTSQGSAAGDGVGSKDHGQLAARSPEIRRAPRRGVSFAGAPVGSEPTTIQDSRDMNVATGPDVIARQLWDNFL